MSVKKNILLTLVFLMSIGLFLGCEKQGMMETEKEYQTTQHTVGVRPKLIQEYPISNATGVALSDWITCTFDEDMQANTLNPNNIKLVRINDKSVIPISLSYEVHSRRLTIKPKFQFQMTNNSTDYQGLRPNTQYRLEFDSKQIKDLDQDLLEATTWNFTTIDLDYGIYFLGSGGEMEKWVSGRVNSYFDQAKPTVLYIHGWQPTSTLNDYCRDNCFFSNNKYVKQMNTIETWRNAGWNVAIFYWSQFADEIEVKDAQAKLYQADNDRKDMRYAYRNGLTVSYRIYNNSSKNMTELAYENYQKVFAGYQKEIRFLGHSLGNQFVTTLAKKVSDQIEAKAIPQSYMPKRLVLLDPFWGKGEEACVGGKWVGEVCRDYIEIMLLRHGLLVEQYKSSLLGGLIADENLEMRKMVCFTWLKPDLIPIQDSADQHSYAYQWYTMSLEKAIGDDAGHYLGAKATNTQIKNQSNWDYQLKKTKNNPIHFYTEKGKDTATPNDDLFKLATGVGSL